MRRTCRSSRRLNDAVATPMNERAMRRNLASAREFRGSHSESNASVLTSVITSNPEGLSNSSTAASSSCASATPHVPADRRGAICLSSRLEPTRWRRVRVVTPVLQMVLQCAEWPVSRCSKVRTIRCRFAAKVALARSRRQGVGHGGATAGVGCGLRNDNARSDDYERPSDPRRQSGNAPSDALTALLFLMFSKLRYILAREEW